MSRGMNLAVTVDVNDIGSSFGSVDLQTKKSPERFRKGLGEVRCGCDSRANY